MSDQPPSIPAPLPVGPVETRERVGSIDVLRGFALLGILVMNIYAFGMPWPVYQNPLLGGGGGFWDMGTWWFSHMFFEMKFMTLFTMLFGAGLILMVERAEARGGRFGVYYYRRLFVLLLIGAFHGYLLWYGDILFWYGICGMALFPFRKASAARLIIVGMLLVVAVTALMLGFGFFGLPKMQQAAEEAIGARDAGESLSEEQEAAIETWAQFHPPPETLQEEVDAYRGSYLDQLKHRVPLVAGFQIMLLFFGWRIVGTMLLGMALMKMGVFSALRSNRFYALCSLLGYGIGLPLVYFGARGLLAAEFDPAYTQQGGYLPNYFGSILIAIGHTGLVMLLCKNGILGFLTRRLAAVGRMALSNYLMQTVICTTFFYGWGFGYFDQLGRLQLMGVVLAVWILQMIYSPLWLSRFQFGPAEWFWRSMTYGKAQPM